MYICLLLIPGRREKRLNLLSRCKSGLNNAQQNESSYTTIFFLFNEYCVLLYHFLS